MKLRDRARRRRVFGSLAPLVPPESMMFEGPPTFEEFHANGVEFLEIYKNIVGLRPDEAVLDVGCGIGRKTIQLTRYLSRDAVYEGFDIAKSGIDWCTEKITSRFGNFRFTHVDVRSHLYNPDAAVAPEEFTFPYPDAQFDVVVLGSVFTHMTPPGVERYTSEIARVLKPRGRALISYFLLNDESLALLDAGRSTIELPHIREDYRLRSVDIPEDVVAHDEGSVRRMYERAGLDIARLEYGSWCGREVALSYQDLVLTYAHMGI